MRVFPIINSTVRRDIYYRDPELFVKQAVVDRCVDDIANFLDVSRSALNVVSGTSWSFFDGRLTNARDCHGKRSYGRMFLDQMEVRKQDLRRNRDNGKQNPGDGWTAHSL